MPANKRSTAIILIIDLASFIAYFLIAFPAGVPAACFITVLLFALKNVNVEKLNLAANTNQIL